MSWSVELERGEGVFEFVREAGGELAHFGELVEAGDAVVFAT